MARFLYVSLKVFSAHNKKQDKPIEQNRRIGRTSPFCNLLQNMESFGLSEILSISHTNNTVEHSKHLDFK